MNGDSRSRLELLRDILRSKERTLDLAGSIASGVGNYSLANSCWAQASLFKRERVEINEQLCRLDNPDYPRKRGSQC